MIGQSFLPAFDEEERKRRMLQQGQGNGEYSPVQEAIKILSMRIPRFSAAGGVAPLSLMTGQGMAGGQNPVVEQILRQFGIANPAGVRPGEPAPGSYTPPPVVIPGSGPGVPPGGNTSRGGGSTPFGDGGDVLVGGGGNAPISNTGGSDSAWSQRNQPRRRF